MRFNNGKQDCVILPSFPSPGSILRPINISDWFGLKTKKYHLFLVVFLPIQKNYYVYWVYSTRKENQKNSRSLAPSPIIQHRLVKECPIWCHYQTPFLQYQSLQRLAFAWIHWRNLRKLHQIPKTFRRRQSLDCTHLKIKEIHWKNHKRRRVFLLFRSWFWKNKGNSTYFVPNFPFQPLRNP